jgi:hypothetical protein
MKDCIVKKQRDFDYLRLFKILQFTQQITPEVVVEDVKRLFVLNKMPIEEERIANVLFGLILKKETMNFEDFCRLLTKKGMKTYVYSATKGIENHKVLKAQ